MKSKLKLNLEEYENLLSMYKSSDTENHVVAGSIVASLNHKNNLVMLAVLAKESGKLLELSVKAPETWEAILTAAKTEDDVNFVLSRFGKEVNEQLVSAGFEFMNKYTITIKANG